MKSKKLPVDLCDQIVAGQGSGQGYKTNIQGVKCPKDHSGLNNGKEMWH